MTIYNFEHDSIRRGPDKTVEFSELKNWSHFDDERIRYYSGTAVYKTSFSLNEISQLKSYVLDLGSCMATAKVKVNGKYVGGVWTYPYQVNVSNALKQGVNNLEVEVINTWKNRLIGDHELLEKKRMVYSRINPWNGDTTLQSAGLLGPVALLSYELKQ